MRLEVPAKDVRPGDFIWFSGDRKPSRVEQVAEQEGAEKLVVLMNNNKTWYLKHDDGMVFKYEEDEQEQEENRVFLDLNGNPT